MRKKTAGSYQFLVTVEHSSADVPNECGDLLVDYIAGSETHRIYDPGAKALAEELAGRLECPLVLGNCTRLAVDLNRSIGSSSQFSPPILESDEALKESLLQNYYLPYRNEAKKIIETSLEKVDSVIHLSIHTFTKVFDGKQRDVDVGILFDNKRTKEYELCQNWVKALQVLLPDLVVKANEPYHGWDDGHTTALRRRFPETRYLGIEIEFSQNIDLGVDAESYAKLLSTTLIKLLP